VSRCVACVLARSACAHVEQFEVDLLLEEEEENDEEPILKFSIVLQYTGVGWLSMGIIVSVYKSVTFRRITWKWAENLGRFCNGLYTTCVEERSYLSVQLSSDAVRWDEIDEWVITMLCTHRLSRTVPTVRWATATRVCRNTTATHSSRTTRCVTPSIHHQLMDPMSVSGIINLSLFYENALIDDENAFE